MSAQELITEHLDLWTGAVTKRSGSGRGSNGKVELTGVKKLRELILELAVRGMLVTQDKDDEPVGMLLKKIESEESAQLKAKTIRKPKQLSEVQEIEQPFPIPDSWRYCRLNELGIWGSGATPKRGNARYYGGGIPWFKSGELYKDFIDSSEETITELAVQETSVRMNQPGDVLIAMYGATIGKASILEVAGTTNQAVCACTPWTGISNRFLLLLLKAYRSRFIAMGAGGAQPNISREKIIATVIGLPPEQEEHRIVQKVDELMALCDRLEQQTSDQLEAHETLVDTLLGTLTQSENATELADNWARLAAHFDTLFTTEQSIDKLKHTILQLAVMGRLVEQSAEDTPVSELLSSIENCKRELVENKKIKAPKKLPAITEDEAAFYIPQNWQWVKFGQLGVFVNGDRSKSYPNKEEYVESGVAWINTGHIRPDGTLTRTDMHFITREKYDSLRGGKIEPTDLVYCLRGATFGKTAFVTPYMEGAIASSLMIVRPYLPAMRSYIYRYLTSPFGRSQIFRFDNGSAQPNLSANSVMLFAFPLPPIEEQHRIVQKVDELMTLCDQLKERLNAAGETRHQLAGAVVEGALS